MATLWETITGNSTLPVQPGTTFYDHLLNQESGGGVTRIVEGDPLFFVDLAQEIDFTEELFVLEISDRQTAINFDLEDNVDLFDQAQDINL